MKTNVERKAETQTVNGIDVEALGQAAEEIATDPIKGQTRWQVRTSWLGGTRSETRVEGYEIGGQRVKKDFRIQTDEPLELFGTNQAPNPQELLMAALNACMTVGYAALCALEGIELEELSIESQGDLDLRGFFALDPSIKPGYEEIGYRIRVKGKGTPEQFQKIHERVQATSPNYFNISQPVRLKGDLVIA
ncbi:MAG TPA: OsmC family protein [bacterium]|nr:OsmC family protein [bacterium]